jgi:regulator of nonsense transcripts 1
MEGAFTNLGNHLVSDSAAAINAGDNDDLSNIDPDESLLYNRYDRRKGLGHARRRDDDDDNETEVLDDEDDESLASVPVAQMGEMTLQGDEEKDMDLPEHACACVQPNRVYRTVHADLH